MLDLFRLLWCAVIGLSRSRAALEAEILVLRHQLMCCAAGPESGWPSAQSTPDICGPLSACSRRIGRAENSQARDGDPLASRWVPSLLALEITAAWWPARDTSRRSPAHP